MNSRQPDPTVCEIDGEKQCGNLCSLLSVLSQPDRCSFLFRQRGDRREDSVVFEVQPQVAQEYAPYSILPSMIWRAPVFPHTWDAQAVVPFTLEETRAPDRASKPN
jgi:hypothetical protein